MSASGASRLAVLHVVPSVNRDVGGPSVSVPRLLASLSAEGVEVHLAALDYPEHGPVIDLRGVQCSLVPSSPAGRALRGYSDTMARELRRLVALDFNLIHNHGMWMIPNIYARRAASRAGIPLVTSPRGMLDDWSMKRSRLRKSIAWIAFERRNLRSARAFHATSTAEAQSIRSMGFDQPIAVIPNGVDIPESGSRPARKMLEERYPELTGKRWLLFMSRLHPKKGVLELLNAWKSLSSERLDWHLILAGSGMSGYDDIVAASVASLGLGRRVTLTGSLNGDAKSCALGNSELFVLPTKSENFGIVIAEALAHGVPVLTTTSAPWSELRDRDCGWWVGTDEESFRSALGQALAAPDRRRKEMGERGRQFIQENYHWSRIAEEMKRFYGWLCYGGDRPQFVVLD